MNIGLHCLWKSMSVNLIICFNYFWESKTPHVKITVRSTGATKQKRDKPKSTEGVRPHT